MSALVAGSGSYIVRLSVRDLHGPTVRTSRFLCTKSLTAMFKRSVVTVGRSRGRKRRPLLLGQIPSFLCSFQKTIGQIVGWCPWEILDPSLVTYTLFASKSLTALFKSPISTGYPLCLFTR